MTRLALPAWRVASPSGGELLLAVSIPGEPVGKGRPRATVLAEAPPPPLKLVPKLAEPKPSAAITQRGSGT